MGVRFDPFMHACHPSVSQGCRSIDGVRACVLCLSGVYFFTWGRPRLGREVEWMRRESQMMMEPCGGWWWWVVVVVVVVVV